MKSRTKFLNLITAAFTAGLIMTGSASAVTFSGVIAEFDDTNDLLRLSGTVTSANSTFNELVFDWDGTLDAFDFSGASLVSSNIGGSLFSPAGGVSGGSFAITNIPGAPFSAPLNFDFLVSISGAGSNFLSEAIDFFVCDDCTPGFIGFEGVANVTTAVAADLSAISPVPVPAALPLFGTGLALLGFMGWRRKRNAA